MKTRISLFTVASHLYLRSEYRVKKWPWPLVALVDSRRSDSERHQAMYEFLTTCPCCMDEGFARRLRRRVHSEDDFNESAPQSCCTHSRACFQMLRLRLLEFRDTCLRLLRPICLRHNGLGPKTTVRFVLASSVCVCPVSIWILFGLLAQAVARAHTPITIVLRKYTLTPAQADRHPQANCTDQPLRMQ
jgi:hypothetical protein